METCQNNLEEEAMELFYNSCTEETEQTHSVREWNLMGFQVIGLGKDAGDEIHHDLFYML